MPSFTRFLISLSSSNSIILFKCFICLNIIGCKDQVRLIICAINIFKYIYNHFSFVNFLSVRGKNKLSKKSSLFEVCQIPRSVLIIINSRIEFTLTKTEARKGQRRIKKGTKLKLSTILDPSIKITGELEDSSIEAFEDQVNVDESGYLSTEIFLILIFSTVSQIAQDPAQVLGLRIWEREKTPDYCVSEVGALSEVAVPLCLSDEEDLCPHCQIAGSG